jgi:chitosanase
VSFRLPPVFIALILLASPAFATDTTKSTAQKLTSVFENSTPVLQYTYIENIHDGRGLTFGFPGFTSGTYDGTMFLKEYKKLNPQNPLAKFILAFEKIDQGPHDSEGCNPSTAGLTGFSKAFKACGKDPAFRNAQLLLVDKLYWNPSQALAQTAGATLPITRAELYDAFITHGEDGVQTMLKTASKAMGGTPKSGINERLWLKKFLAVRFNVMKADPTWKEALDRVRVYQKLLAGGNIELTLPLKITCYGDTFTIR